MASKGQGSKYTPELAARICERLADGETLRAICKDEDMPHEATVRGWVMQGIDDFATHYARAREIGYHTMADHLIELIDTPVEGVTITTKRDREGVMYDEVRKGDMIEHRRLQVDTRKWLLSKCLPKIYGDKFSVESDVTIHDSIDKPPGETRAQWIERKRRELATTPVQGHADG